MDIKDDDKERRHAVALFRYGLIADLLHWPRGKRGLGEMIAKKAEREHDIPGSRRCRVAPETIRDWLKDYRQGGFDALLPKPRRDQGQARAIPQSVVDLLCMVKEDKPALLVRMVIEAARASAEVPQDVELAPATVHRVLSRAGLMERRPDEPTSNDRRRFSYLKAGELWMSDVMHGPAVLDERKRRRKTYLISFIDDATRVIPYGAFALGENVACFLPVFEQAIRRRGIPKRLYVDSVPRNRIVVLCPAGICARGPRPRERRGPALESRHIIFKGQRASSQVIKAASVCHGCLRPPRSGARTGEVVVSSAAALRRRLISA